MNVIFKKILVLSLVLVFILSMFISCNQKNEKNSTDDNKVSFDKNVSVEINCITKDIFATQPDEAEHALRKIVDNFNIIYPNVKLSITTFSEDDFIPVVKSIFEGTYKEHVDIIIASPEEILNVSSLDKAEDISDLMALLEENAEKEESSSKSESSKKESSTESESTIEEEKIVKINENIKNLANLGGTKPVFYPIAVSANVMAFNKNILERTGMLSRLPQTENRGWTFAEYKSFMTDLYAAISPEKIDGGVLYYGASSDATDTINLFKNVTGLDVAQVNTPEGVAFLNEIKELTNSSILINGVTSQKSESIERFIKEEVASTFSYNLGLDLINFDKKKGGFDVVFMPMPSKDSPKFSYNVIGASILKLDEKTDSTASTSEQSKDANNPEARLFAAKEFLNFIGNNKDITGYFAGNIGMYSYKNEFNDFLTDEYAYLKQTVEYLGEYNQENNPVVTTSWINMLRKILFLDFEIESSTNAFIEALTTPPA